MLVLGFGDENEREGVLVEDFGVENERLPELKPPDDFGELNERLLPAANAGAIATPSVNTTATTRARIRFTQPQGRMAPHPRRYSQAQNFRYCLSE